MRKWCPQTLKTAVDAMALMYKQTCPPNGIVPGAQIQFPKYCRFYTAGASRARNNAAWQPVVAVLHDPEVVALFDKTNWLSWHEAQRMNLLLLAYQLGQRPESLIRLRVGNFHLVPKDENGRHML